MFRNRGRRATLQVDLSANVASTRVEFNSRKGQRFKNGNRRSGGGFHVNRANGAGSTGNVNQGAKLKQRRGIAAIGAESNRNLAESQHCFRCRYWSSTCCFLTFFNQVSLSEILRYLLQKEPKTREAPSYSYKPQMYTYVNNKSSQKKGRKKPAGGSTAGWEDGRKAVTNSNWICLFTTLWGSLTGFSPWSCTSACLWFQAAAAEDTKACTAVQQEPFGSVNERMLLERRQ